LQDRDDILVPALYSRLAGRPLFSDELEEGRRLTDEEIRYGLDRLAELLPDRAPVLEDEFAVSAEAVRSLLGSDEQALDDLNVLSEEVLDLTFQAIALDQPVPDYQASRCPFPGLKAFQTDDEAYFFGRDEAVDALLKRLNADRFLAVLGISGSGKSSLVLAGMVPKLIEQAKSVGQTLDYRALTPGNDPETALAKQLQTPLPAGQPALLVIDQFEELFTLSTDPEARGRFLENLLKVGKDNPDLHTILTLRADFWGDCAPFEAFRQQMQAHQELLPPMTTTELRSAMEQQAASVGLRFEADLSHTILAEVEGEPGAMPLLQHLLRELWKRRHGRWLRASEYHKLGGIKKAIAHTADEIYEQLIKQDPGGEDLMRNLFVRLTRLDDKSEGEEQHRDTRQRVPFDDLVPAGTDSDRVRRLVQRLADARLLVITTDQETQQFEVEVSHEALIRHWPRLRTWLDEDRESWMLLAAVRQQAMDWDKRGKKDGDLPRWGERLLQAEALFGLERFSQSELEQEFLCRAKALAERERQEKEAQDRREREALMKATEEAERTVKAQRGKTRASLIGLGVAALLLLGAGYFGLQAYWNEQKAVAAKEEAVAAKEMEKIAKNKAIKETERAEEKERDAYRQLAVTNVNNAVDERNNDAPLKAAQYFARASETFIKLEEPKSAGNFELARKTSYPGSMLKAVVGHAASVRGAVFSADQDRILTWSRDGTARLWDASSGEAMTPPLAHKDIVYGARFSADGKRILTWSADGTARVWDAGSGEAVTPPLKHEDGVLGAEFSADQRRILTWSGNLIGGGAGVARVWNATSGEAVTPPLKHERAVDGARFSPDQDRILTWSGDSARVWDATSGEEKMLLKHEEPVNGARFSAGQDRILTWSRDGTARVWDAGSGEAITPPLKHEWVQFAEIHGALFSTDQMRVLTLRRDGTARFWDISIDSKWPEDQRLLRTEVETGTELTSTGELQALSADAWQMKKWCEYDKILYDLKRTSPEQWQTSQSLCRELKKRIGAMAPDG
jgi:hypothetical protein